MKTFIVPMYFILDQCLTNLYTLVIDFVKCVTSQLQTVLRNLIKIQHTKQKQNCDLFYLNRSLLTLTHSSTRYIYIIKAAQSKYLIMNHNNRQSPVPILTSISISIKMNIHCDYVTAIRGFRRYIGFFSSNSSGVKYQESIGTFYKKKTCCILLLSLKISSNLNQCLTVVN